MNQHYETSPVVLIHSQADRGEAKLLSEELGLLRTRKRPAKSVCTLPLDLVPIDVRLRQVSKGQTNADLDGDLVGDPMVVVLWSRNCPGHELSGERFDRLLYAGRVIPILCDEASLPTDLKNIYAVRLPFKEEHGPRGWRSSTEYMKVLRAIKAGLELGPRIEELLAGKEPEIFVSYDFGDAEKARQIVRGLRVRLPGRKIWWAEDDLIPGSLFEKRIDDALRKVKCLVGVWSRGASRSQWVNSEIKGQARICVLAKLDETEICEEVRKSPQVDLTHWDDAWDSVEFDQLVWKIKELITEKAVEVNPSSAENELLRNAAIYVYPEGCFQQYFGKVDDEWRDPRFASAFPRSPAGPLASTRWCSAENASTVIASPQKLDLHLSYSAGLENGPIIERTGSTAPTMEDPDRAGLYTTDPDIQRIGAYFISPEQKATRMEELSYLFAGNCLLLASMSEADGQDAMMTVSEKASTLLGRSVKVPHPPKLDIGNLWPQIAAYAKALQSTIGAARTSKSGDESSHEESVTEWQQQQAPFSEAGAKKCMEMLYEKSFNSYVWDMKKYFGDPSFREAVSYNFEKYLRLLLVATTTPCHIKSHDKYGGHDVLIAQGCGDLTMNEWNVAFIARRGMRKDNNWRLLHAKSEPLNDRTYTCLVKWSCSRGDPALVQLATKARVVYPYQIAEVSFHVPSLDRGEADRHVLMAEQPIGHMIEFAVYGQRLCRSGETVDLEHICHQFSDLRHLFRLPNLNPEDSYEVECGRRSLEGYNGRPRNLFNRVTGNSVWLGEAALSSGGRNLVMAALRQPVQIEAEELGAPVEWVDAIMERQEKRYRSYSRTDGRPEFPGQWRWISEGRTRWLEIFFLRSQYPSSMIGVRAPIGPYAGRRDAPGLCDTQYLYFLAHGHGYSWEGCTLEEAGKYLLSIGATDVLSFDEGFDVFQMVRDDGGTKLREAVPLKRQAIRCVFVGIERTSPERVESGT